MVFGVGQHFPVKAEAYDISIDRNPHYTSTSQLELQTRNYEPGLCRAKRSVLPVEVGFLVHLAFRAKFQLSHRRLIARKRTHGTLIAFGMKVTRA